jgi:cyclophilin family peptidyl-prolyl cis-trans isomerase
MIVLDTTSKSITIVMTGAAATTNPSYTTAYADNNGTSFTEGASDGILNGTSAVTVVSAPASSTRRIVNTITVENNDTAAVTITVGYLNTASTRVIAKVTLQVGDTWTTNGAYDTNGNLKQTMGTVNLATQVTGTLPIANGGTGATSLASASIATYTGTETLTNKTLTNPTVTNYVESVVAIGNSSTSQTLALTNGTVQTVTMTGNCTFTMPTATAGKSFILICTQDATGSRTAVFTSVKWAGGTAPTLTTTATTGVDILTFVANGTSWFGTYAQAFA